MDRESRWIADASVKQQGSKHQQQHECDPDHEEPHGCAAPLTACGFTRVLLLLMFVLLACLLVVLTFGAVIHDTATVVNERDVLNSPTAAWSLTLGLFQSRLFEQGLPEHILFLGEHLFDRDANFELVLDRVLVIRDTDFITGPQRPT